MVECPKTSERRKTVVTRIAKICKTVITDMWGVTIFFAHVEPKCDTDTSGRVIKWNSPVYELAKKLKDDGPDKFITHLTGYTIQLGVPCKITTELLEVRWAVEDIEKTP